MRKNIFIAGFVWGLSVMAAGWIGKTWFSQSTPLPPPAGNSLNVAQTAPATLVVAGATPSPEENAAAQEAARVATAGYFSKTSIPPNERMNRALELDDPLEKMSAFVDVLKSLKTAEDFTAALGEMSNSSDPRARGRELGMLMTEWAKRDPEAALAAAGSLQGWQSRAGTSSALVAWTKMDPNAAKTWALAKSKDFKEDEGNSYMTSVIAGLAKTDLALASTWALEQPRSRARGDMIDSIIENYAKQRGTSAAEQWVAGLPEGTFRDGATRRVASKLTEEDPTKAASWISALPQNETKYGAMSDLMGRWGEKDPNAAGTWLKNLQPSKETDEPRQNFAWTIREKDPESAIAWAGTISDPKRRDRVLVDLVRDWGRRDKKGAQDYMVRNRWPETAMKKVGG